MNCVEDILEEENAIDQIENQYNNPDGSWWGSEARKGSSLGKKEGGD